MKKHLKFLSLLLTLAMLLTLCPAFALANDNIGPQFDLCNGEDPLTLAEILLRATDDLEWHDFYFDSFYTAPVGGKAISDPEAQGSEIYYAHWRNQSGKTVLTAPITISDGGDLTVGGKALDNETLKACGISYSYSPDNGNAVLTLDNAKIDCFSATSCISSAVSLTLKIKGDVYVVNENKSCKADTVASAANLTVTPADGCNDAELSIYTPEESSYAALSATKNLLLSGDGLSVFLYGDDSSGSGVRAGNSLTVQNVVLSASGAYPLTCSSFTINGGILFLISMTNPRAYAFSAESYAAVKPAKIIAYASILTQGEDAHFDDEKNTIVLNGEPAHIVEIVTTSYDLCNGTPAQFKTPVETPSYGNGKTYVFDGWYTLPIGGDKVVDPANACTLVSAHWLSEGNPVLPTFFPLGSSELILDPEEAGIQVVSSGDNRYRIPFDGQSQSCDFTVSCEKPESAVKLSNYVDAQFGADNGTEGSLTYHRFNGIPTAEYTVANADNDNLLDMILIMPDGCGTYVKLRFEKAKYADGSAARGEEFIAYFAAYGIFADGYNAKLGILNIVQDMTLAEAQTLAAVYESNSGVQEILRQIEDYDVESRYGYSLTLEENEAPFELMLSELEYVLSCLEGHQLSLQVVYEKEYSYEDCTNRIPFWYCDAELTDMNGNTYYPIQGSEAYYGVFSFDNLAPGYYRLDISACTVPSSVPSQDMDTKEASKMICIGSDPQKLTYYFSDTACSRIIKEKGDVHIIADLSDLSPFYYSQLPHRPGTQSNGDIVNGTFVLSAAPAAPDAPGVTAIREISPAEKLDFFDISLSWKEEITELSGKVEHLTTPISDLSVSTLQWDNAIMMLIPCNTAGNRIYVYRYHNGSTETFRQVSSLPVRDFSQDLASRTYPDGVFYVGDGYVIIYGNKFSTYAIGSSPIYYGDPNPTVTVPVSGEENTVNVKAAVSGNTAIINGISDVDLEKALGGEGKGKGGVVEIDLTGLNQPVNAVTLPASTVGKIADAPNAEGMSVKLSTADVTLDAAATKAIAEQAGGGTVKLAVDMGTDLNAKQKEALSGENIAFTFEAYLESKGEIIHDFKGGSATVSVRFTPEQGKKAENHKVYYIDENGLLQRYATKYESGRLTFITGHFSTYVIIYEEQPVLNCPKDETCPLSAFTDLKPDAWYHDGVHYCVESGLMNGMSETAFAPNGTITRAQIVAMLYRLEGQVPFMNDNVFTDVTRGAWYERAVVWADGKNIITGYPDGTFRPNDPVTREQLVTILYRYAKYKEIDVAVDENTNFLSFNDFWDVNEYAKDAMMWALTREIVRGDDGNILPLSSATRAEAATMMMRFCEAIGK